MSQAATAQADVSRLQQQREAACKDLQHSLEQLDRLRRDVGQLGEAAGQQAQRCRQLEQEVQSQQAATEALQDQLQRSAETVTGAVLQPVGFAELLREANEMQHVATACRACDELYAIVPDACVNANCVPQAQHCSRMEQKSACHLVKQSPTHDSNSEVLLL